MSIGFNFIYHNNIFYHVMIIYVLTRLSTLELMRGFSFIVEDRHPIEIEMVPLLLAAVRQFRCETFYGRRKSQ